MIEGMSSSEDRKNTLSFMKMAAVSKIPSLTGEITKVGNFSTCYSSTCGQSLFFAMWSEISYYSLRVSTNGDNMAEAASVPGNRLYAQSLVGK